MRLRSCLAAVGLATVVESVAFELGAKKAWDPGSEEMDAVADQTIFERTSRTETQCYSGNEKYLLKSVKSGLRWTFSCSAACRCYVIVNV